MMSAFGGNSGKACIDYVVSMVIMLTINSVISVKLLQLSNFKIIKHLSY